MRVKQPQQVSILVVVQHRRPAAANLPVLSVAGSTTPKRHARSRQPLDVYAARRCHACYIDTVVEIATTMWRATYHTAACALPRGSVCGSGRRMWLDHAFPALDKA